MTSDRSRRGYTPLVVGIALVILVAGLGYKYFSGLKEWNEKIVNEAQEQELTVRQHDSKTLPDSQSTDMKTMDSSTSTVSTSSSSTFSSDKQRLTVREAMALYPDCFSDNLLSYKDDKPYLDLKTIGKWVDSTEPPRYDHVSCFVYKARYNCAYPPGEEPEHVSTDYKLVLTSEHAGTTTTCDLAPLMTDIGGPVGVFEYLRELKEENVLDHPIVAHLNTSRPFNAVILGNSAMRQPYETMTCGFRDYITALHLLYNASTLDNDDYNASMTGTVIDALQPGIDVRTNGCHVGTDGYYRDGVVVPPNDPNCKDDLAMTEYGGIVRFHYIYHLENYADPLPPLNSLGLEPEDVDMYLTLLQPDKRRGMFSFRDRTVPWAIDNAAIYDKDWFGRSQRTQLGYWYGALNPHFKKPDSHSCIPGAVDDFANLILFTIMRGVTHMSTRQGVTPFQEWYYDENITDFNAEDEPVDVSGVGVSNEDSPIDDSPESALNDAVETTDEPVAPEPASNSSGRLSVRQAMVKYPDCFSDDLLSYEDGKPYWDFTKIAHWVDSVETPRYDHLSCFVYKSRYNCAYPPGEEPEHVATDYKLVLQRKGGDISCDMSRLMTDIGGPVGVFEYLRELKEENDDSHPMAANLNTSRPFNVVILGNSGLRQPWEAMTCGFRDHITALHLLYDSADSNPSEYHALFTGEVVDALQPGIDVRTQGCHVGTEGYFREGVTVPPNDPNCSDNIAMTEFDGLVRFHYIYNLEHYVVPSSVFESLALQPEDVDMYVTMTQPAKRSGMFSFRDRTMPWATDNAAIIDKDWYGRSQMDQLGYWYGALNPYFEVPDTHSCLPGPVDDAVNFMLLTILRGVTPMKTFRNRSPFQEWYYEERARR